MGVLVVGGIIFDYPCITRDKLVNMFVFIDFFSPQMSSIKRIVPRLNSILFKMRFSELVSEVKPVSNLNFFV